MRKGRAASWMMGSGGGMMAICLIGLVMLMMSRISACVSFEQDIEGRLKRAADANTIDLAKQEMEAAVKGIREWNLCTKADLHYRGKGMDHGCYTNLFWRLPSDDVLFWRMNLEAALEDLEKVPEDADRLTISNTLMKLRETILDEGKGVTVTIPPGISVYPNNVLYFWLLIGFMVFLCVGAALWLRGWDS